LNPAFGQGGPDPADVQTNQVSAVVTAGLRAKWPHRAWGLFSLLLLHHLASKLRGQRLGFQFRNRR
jgi:hypothetical protein